MVQNLLKSSVPKRWAWLTKPSGVGFVCPQTALNVQRFPEQITGPRRLHINRVGQNHIYTVHMRCFGQGNYQIHGHERCIYTVLASSTPKRCTHTHHMQCAATHALRESTTEMGMQTIQYLSLSNYEVHAGLTVSGQAGWCTA